MPPLLAVCKPAASNGLWYTVKARVACSQWQGFLLLHSRNIRPLPPPNSIYLPMHMSSNSSERRELPPSNSLYLLDTLVIKTCPSLLLLPISAEAGCLGVAAAHGVFGPFFLAVHVAEVPRQGDVDARVAPVFLVSLEAVVAGVVFHRRVPSTSRQFTDSASALFRNVLCTPRSRLALGSR